MDGRWQGASPARRRASGQAEGLLALDAGVAGPLTWHVRMAGWPCEAWSQLVRGYGPREPTAWRAGTPGNGKNGGCRVWGQEVL